MTEEKHTHTEGCKNAFSRMSEYLDRELDPENLKRLEDHFSSCPLCVAVLKTLRKTIEVFKGKPDAEIPQDVADGLRVKLKESIESENKA